jgi:hypothetical protein
VPDEPSAEPPQPETLRLAASHEDLRSALTFAQMLEHPPQVDEATWDTLCEALTTAFIVTYSRPFRTSRGDKSLVQSKLDINAVMRLSEIELRVHNRILGLRDQYSAHSDAWPRQLRIETSPIVGKVVAMADTRLRFGPATGAEWRGLAQRVLSGVAAKLSLAGINGFTK